MSAANNNPTGLFANVPWPNALPGSRFAPGQVTSAQYFLKRLMLDNGTEYGRVMVQEDERAGAVTTTVYALVFSNDASVPDTMAHLEFSWSRAPCGHGLSFGTKLKGLAMRDDKILGLAPSRRCFVRGIGHGVAFETTYGNVVAAIEWTDGATIAHVLVPGDTKDFYVVITPSNLPVFLQDVTTAIGHRVVPHDANLDDEPNMIDLVLVAHDHDVDEDKLDAPDLDKNNSDNVPDVDTTHSVHRSSAKL